MKQTHFAGFAIVAAVAGALLTTAPPADAAIYYPWCARYSGAGTGGGDNCYFVSRAQCMETVRGIGGVCEPNLFYDAARADERAPTTSKAKRRY